MSSAEAAAHEQPILSIRQAAKRLGGWPALRGVDLTLFPGEILVLLGPNGAGKSTLLSAACGRLALDTGTVSLAGEDPRRVAGVRAQLGFVPQHLAVYPYLTVRENLEVFGRMMGVPRSALPARVREAAAWAGLSGRLDAHSDALSGGMRRRLNIVASLLHRPRVLLLDEPTVGVDMDARERVHELLRRLRDDGLGVLLTTHDLAQAEALADRVLVMLDGRIRLAGSPAQLVESEFHGMQELKLVLREVPDAPGRALLRSLDLRPARGELAWTGPVAGDFSRLGELDARLREVGLTPAELRVRAPGLEGVLLRVTGEEIGP
ncbi:MAG: ABC transporter ATP-binding protein [Gammaproteobacteria bacterium]|nr:MAG: ABC transporter ATP-binding protein [Gammaproteobacteria bacterium]